MARQGTRLRDQFGHPVFVETGVYRVHEGEMFVGGHFWSESASTTMVADNETVVILVKPGNFMHVVRSVAAGGDCEIYHHKGVTTAATSAGNTITPINHNCGSNKTSACGMYWGSTAMIASFGTAFPGVFSPGGTGGNSVGGITGGHKHEYVLSSTDIYATAITNRSGLVIPISLTYEWYEPGASS